MSRKTTINVVPSDGKGGRRTGTGWRVVTGQKHKGTTISTHSNKDPAIRRARQYARAKHRRPTLLRIYKTDGTIGETAIYS